MLVLKQSLLIYAYHFCFQSSTTPINTGDVED